MNYIENRKAIIVQFINDRVPFYDKEEFEALVKAAKYDIVDYISQKSSKINPKYLIGKGKAEEIKETYSDMFEKKLNVATKVEKRLEEDLVYLFNNRLNSSQIVNLSELFETKVIDRDLVILEIFELNARTKEAKLQIKLARLELEKSRIQKVLSEELKSERPGRDFMGKGYGAFDAYSRSFKEMKKKILTQLKKEKLNRQVQRKARRRHVFNVSIVGYTNAGKTTFLNTIKDEDFKTKSTAFTTTTTVSRRIIYDNQTYVFTDTVGFVYDIPHQIVEAFLSTLEEAKYSNCLLLIIDFSDSFEKIKQKIHTTFQVLLKIEALNLPIIYAFNKVDLITNDELESKKNKISELLPKNSITYYFSALDEKEVNNIIKIIDLIKNQKILLPNNVEFAKDYLISDLNL